MELLRLFHRKVGVRIYNLDVFGSEKECREHFMEEHGYEADPISQSFSFDVCGSSELGSFARNGEV